MPETLYIGYLCPDDLECIDSIAENVLQRERILKYEEDYMDVITNNIRSLRRRAGVRRDTSMGCK